MDRGTDRDTAPRPGAGHGAAEPAAAGRIPLAVVVVDRDGLVSHWSTGARRLFAVTKEEAIGRPAADLLPVSGALPEEDESVSYGPYAAYDGLGPDLESSLDGRLSYPAAGRARLTVSGSGRGGSGGASLAAGGLRTWGVGHECDESVPGGLGGLLA